MVQSIGKMPPGFQNLCLQPFSVGAGGSGPCYDSWSPLVPQFTEEERRGPERQSAGPPPKLQGDTFVLF